MVVDRVAAAVAVFVESSSHLLRPFVHSLMALELRVRRRRERFVGRNLLLTHRLGRRLLQSAAVLMVSCKGGRVDLVWSVVGSCRVELLQLSVLVLGRLVLGRMKL